MSGIKKEHKFLGRPISRWIEVLSAVSVDALILNICLILSCGLFYNFRIPSSAWNWVFYSSLIATPIALLLLYRRKLYQTHIRYIGFRDFTNIVLISFITTLILGSVIGWAQWRSNQEYHVAIYALFGLLAASALVGTRLVKRFYDWRSTAGPGTNGRPTLIVGAGDAGEMIIREVTRSQAAEYKLIGFVDDNTDKSHVIIHGIRGLGTTEDIPRLALQHSITEILIAIPSASGADLRRIFNLCRETKARVRILPSIPAVFEGDATLHQFREVHIEDLLRRDPVKSDLKEVATYVSGERVLITGAGGSIGGELARQVASLGPASLLLLGKGENSIYEIEQELIHLLGFCPRCIIADVRDQERMRRLMLAEQPSVVFHAAAHKHVPLMEANPHEAIKNNILGTWVTAEAAIRAGVKKFIYVSTDKAVNPASIMGATKRVGEMIVSALAQRSETEFAIVRFGNVLGSRGSLIPTLQAQIARGGPVCITHPEMKRYFMTIPEAVQLIIQAGAIGEHRGVFVLDMGEPVRILDIAHDLIRFYGLVPNEDIKIMFTGARPGEKLSEELYYDSETICETRHPKIYFARNFDIPDWEWLKGHLVQLEELGAQGQTEAARELLMELAWGKLMPYPPTQRSGGAGG